MTSAIGAIGATILLFSGCGEMRDPLIELLGPAQLTCVDDVRRLLKQKCTRCHSGVTPEGGYDLSSWRGLLGPNKDTVSRNVVPGDAKSPLLSTVGADANTTHKDLLNPEELSLLRRWVVNEKAAYFRSDYHPRDWLYPGDRNALTFHGGLLRSRRWDTTACQTCHGQDLKGGTSKVSCATCHSKGTDDCGTCHGTLTDGGPPPSLSWSLDPTKDRGVGAHAAHRSTVFGALSCSECHSQPTKVDDANHLFDDASSKTTDLRAEVTFGARSALGGVKADYDKETGLCTVYCHGATFEEGKKPQWLTKPTGNCATCHSVPAKFGGADCSVCHQQVVELCVPGEKGCLKTGEGVGTRFFDPKTHGDGKLVIGKAGVEDTCHGCHGTEASKGAPAPDLRGKTATTEVTVGLHQLHLAAGTTAEAVACAACHKVPKEAKEAGHFDNDLPAEVVFARQASADRRPTWDRKTATCSDTYCHALDGGDVTTWSWTKRVAGGLTCTSCHGQPPRRTSTGKIHTVSQGCSRAGCHRPAYKDGKLDPQKHINGQVEVDL